MVEKKCSAEDVITKLQVAEERSHQAKTVAENLYTLLRIRQVNVRHTRGGTEQKDRRMNPAVFSCYLNSIISYSA